MTGQDEIKALLVNLKKEAPAGYAVALHIKFTTPTFLFQTYTKDWLDYYSQNGLVMSDPTVLWGFENIGQAKWWDLAAQDHAGVMKKAAEYGLKYGLTCACETGSSRSIGSFAHSDHDFTEKQAAILSAKLDQLHAATADLKTLAPETAEALRMLTINVTHPGLG